MTTTNEVRIYCGTYAKYNAGSIAGAWMDLEEYSDRESFLEACAKLHSDESDPEFMFQDFEGFPRCWYSESSAPEAILWEWLELDESERRAFKVYADHIGDGATIEEMRDAYQGTADSEADFAQNIAEETGCIPKDLPDWIVIDWEASWNSSLRYDFFSDSDDEGTLHFFRNS